MKVARALKGWTLDQLSGEMDGTSNKSFLSGIEHGKREISVRTVGRLVIALDLEELWVARFVDAEVDPEAEVTEVDRRTDKLLEEAKKLDAAGITEEAVIGYAQRAAGETEDLAQAWKELQKLLEIALALQAKAATGTNHHDLVDEVLKRAAERSREGDNSGAVSGIEDALAEHQAQALRLLESGADYALLDGNTKRAADFLIQKADMEAGGQTEFRALRGLWAHYYVEGRDKGLNLELRLSIAIAREVLKRASAPDERGTAGNDIGNALFTLGARESGPDRLEEAVAAYRNTLEENTRERVPLEWAGTQMNLGNALATLGQRESGTERLEQAVTAYRNALEERTRKRVPLHWATTQMNLGNALSILGQRESGTERLEEAVTAYRNALEEFTRESRPLDWAKTQMNLGTALKALGERESGTERLVEAVTAFRNTLEENTRERVPLEWAKTQMNLGSALSTLGERESGTERLEEAVTAYRNALEERTRERVPLDWATTQMNLGNALKALGERESGPERLVEAVTAFRNTLEENTRECVPLEWAKTQMNLGNALKTLGQRESGTDRLEEAVIAYRNALKERTRESVPFQWAMTQHCLSGLELAFFDKTEDPQHLVQAMKHAKAAEEVFLEAGADYYIDWIARLIAHIEAQR